MKKGRARRVAIGAAAMIWAVCAIPAQAGSVANATIVQLVPESPNGFFIYVNVAPPSGTTPSCATETLSAYRYVVDLTTDAGKATVATALMVFAMKSSIDIVGTGNCSVWSDTETVRYIQVH